MFTDVYKKKVLKSLRPNGKLSYAEASKKFKVSQPSIAKWKAEAMQVPDRAFTPLRDLSSSFIQAIISERSIDTGKRLELIKVYVQ